MAKDAAKRDNAEHGLSHWVDAFLDRTLLGNCWYTAIEGGTWLRSLSPEARMNAEAKRKARGIKPAHLDWYAWQESTGKFTQFELKVDRRRYRRVGQDQTMELLRRNNIPTAVCETVPQVWEFLVGAGVPHCMATPRTSHWSCNERYSGSGTDVNTRRRSRCDHLAGRRRAGT